MTSGLPHIKAKAREMRAAGAKTLDIATELGVHPRTAHEWVRGVTCPVNHYQQGALRRMADPDYRAVRVAALAQSNEKRKAVRAKSPPSFEIPGWVERAGLVREFARIARLNGEEAAASACRKLKAARVEAASGQIKSSQFGAAR
jgi:hypothetical protein